MLVFVAAITFAPVVYELMLGQVTLLIAAAIYPVVRRDDAVRTGIPLGIALALAPKPLLLPLLFWILVWRRRAFGGTLATALTLTLVGVVLAGPNRFQSWLSVLTTLGSQSAAGTAALLLNGNYSLWPLTQLTLPVAVAVGVASVWTTLRDGPRGFAAAILACAVGVRRGQPGQRPARRRRLVLAVDSREAASSATDRRFIDSEFTHVVAGGLVRRVASLLGRSRVTLVAAGR